MSDYNQYDQYQGGQGGYGRGGGGGGGGRRGGYGDDQSYDQQQSYDDQQGRQGRRGGGGYDQQDQGYGQQDQGYGQQDQGYGQQDQRYDRGQSDSGNYQDTSYSMDRYDGADIGGDDGGQGDFSGAAHIATQHAGDSGDHSMFSNAIQSLQGKSHQGGIDEQSALDAHQQVYNQGGSGGLSGNTIGTAAALQTLKSMLGGGGSAGQNTNNAFVGKAMSAAAQLFDQHDAQGNIQQGTKQQAISAAAGMAMKLLHQSGGNVGSGGQGIAGMLLNAAGGGGQGGGQGAQQLMGLVGKLM